MYKSCYCHLSFKTYYFDIIKFFNTVVKIYTLIVLVKYISIHFNQKCVKLFCVLKICYLELIIISWKK